MKISETVKEELSNLYIDFYLKAFETKQGNMYCRLSESSGILLQEGEILYALYLMISMNMKEWPSNGLPLLSVKRKIQFQSQTLPLVVKSLGQG
jgi:hypothetical protein